jgi:hypothetical protein
LKVKNWKETAKDRRIWRNLAEKVKTHKGLWCQMMMMMMIKTTLNYFQPHIDKTVLEKPRWARA